MARGAYAVGNHFSAGSPPVTAPPFTVAFWAYVLAAHNGVAFILGDTAGDVNNFRAYFTVGGPFYFACQDAAGVAYAVGPDDYTTGVWQHYAFVTYSATSRYACLGGVFGAEQTTDRQPAGVDTFALGVKKVSGVTMAFNGYLADVGLWDAGLSSAQIVALAAGAEPAMIQRANLVAAWRCTPGAANLVDIMGTYDLTEVGAVAHQTHPPIERLRSHIRAAVRRG